MLRRYDAYLFDLDGTLIDTAPDLHAALNHCLQLHGLHTVDEATTRHWVGHGARAMLNTALEHQPEAAHQSETERSNAVERLLEDFLSYYRAHSADHSTLYPEVKETLLALHAQGAALGVVTNKMFSMTGPILDAFELTPLFGSIIGGDTASHPKPHAAPVLMALEQLSVEPAQALFVGDSTTDVGGARAAAVDVVCVPYGYNQGTAPELLGADAVITTFADLLVV